MPPVPTARACPICAARRGWRIWSEAGYHYVRCGLCGSVFANLSEAEYERVRHNAWDEEVPDVAATQFYGPARERAHDDFLDRRPPVGNRRLLDVGCGLGYFLARAQARGWDVHGTDTSATWVQLANSRLGGRRVELATIEEAQFTPASFALITAWDVLEHIFEPVPFLARLRELLAPDGRLFIRTPNITYGYPVYAVRRWLLGHDVGLGPTNHVVYFTAATMRRALADAGLRACAWPVHVPPQVTPRADGGADYRAEATAVIKAKNAFSRFAESVADRTDGRLAVGSDLDVICAAAPDPRSGPVS